MWKMGGDEERFTGSWRRFYKVEVSQRVSGELVSFQGETETATNDEEEKNNNFQDEHKGGMK